MRYAVLGGDMRFAHLAEMLKEGGRMAAGFLQEKAGGKLIDLQRLSRCDCVIANWPLKWPLSNQEVTTEEIMDNIAPGTVMLLCGPQFPGEKRWDLQYVNLWQDETLLQENAYLTAEGAVAAVMARMEGKLAGVDCLVVGYGRIGRALTEILINLGAEVTVATGSRHKQRKITESGATPADIASINACLPSKRIIFSTPPSMVLDHKALQSAEPDALIVDLASPPYGVDLDAAAETGLKAWREPGLPGRYCPVSAARVLYNAVVRWEEENDNED